MRKRMSEAELALFMAELQKISGLTKSEFKPVQQASKKYALEKERRAYEAQTEKESSDKEHELKPSLTMDMHLYQLCFPVNKFIVMNDGFYQYDSKHGYWLALPDKDVLKRITEATHSSYKWMGSKSARYKKYLGGDSAAKSGLKYSRSMLTLTDKDTPENKHIRAFGNCSVDMRTGRAMQHSPSHYLTSAIAADYSEGEDCPDVFMQFISTSYGEEMIPFVRAAFSMLLDPTAPWGKFIHIIGPSGSGKGVMLRLLQMIFGKNAIGTSSFEEISNPDKRHQNLKNCDLYVIGDISGYIKGLETFYDLVDNAPMTGRALNSSDAYSRKWDIRFALASVQYLQLENTAGGWDRRVFPILSQRRPPDSNIPNLENELEMNLSGIISWALAMDKAERNKLLKEPWKYSERVANAMHESKVHGDSVASFVDSCLRPIKFNPKKIEVPTVEKAHLHDWYIAYCRAHNLQPKGSAKFLGHLKTVIPKHFEPRRRYTAEETSQKDSDGKRKRKPSRWIWLEADPQIFTHHFDERTNEQKPGFICRKAACKEGNLELFASWEPALESCLETKVVDSDVARVDRVGPETGPELKPSDIKGGQGGQSGQGKKAEKDQDPNLERF